MINSCGKTLQNLYINKPVKFVTRDRSHPEIDLSDWAKTVEIWWVWGVQSPEENVRSGIFMERNKRGRLTHVKRIESNHFFSYIHPEKTWELIKS